MDTALLERLSNAYGPPGSEDEVREILKAELEEYADETQIDKLGNIIFTHRGKEGKPLIMLAAAPTRNATPVRQPSSHPTIPVSDVFSKSPIRRVTNAAAGRLRATMVPY